MEDMKTIRLNKGKSWIGIVDGSIRRDPCCHRRCLLSPTLLFDFQRKRSCGCMSFFFDGVGVNSMIFFLSYCLRSSWADRRPPYNDPPSALLLVFVPNVDNTNERLFRDTAVSSPQAPLWILVQFPPPALYLNAALAPSLSSTANWCAILVSSWSLEDVFYSSVSAWKVSNAHYGY